MDCKYKRIRSKKYVMYMYCIKLKRDIKSCDNCIHREYKPFKPIRKRSVNKVVVDKKMYDKVLKRDKSSCILCKLEGIPELIEGQEFRLKNLELHHIIPRSKDIKRVNDVDNCCMLCSYCHHERAHKNMKKYIKVLQDYIKNKKRK